MKSLSRFAIVISTLYLLTYSLMAQAEIDYRIIYSMFACSPVIVIWLAYCILKFGEYNGRELGNDEWGYQDHQP